MKNKFFFVMIITISTVLGLALLCNIGISGIELSSYALEDLKKQYPKHDIFVMCNAQTTGPSWQVVNYSENLPGELVVLDFPFDPWALKLNRETDLVGLQVYFVIVADKENKTVKYPGLDEEFMLIKASRVFIDTVSLKEDIGSLKLKDVSLFGIVKAFVGLFIPSVRYSY